MSTEALDPTILRDLARPEAYPDDPTASEGVESIQTHISHLFLTRSRVVKLRKAVDLGFLDFSTRARRLRDCEREVRLNRRLAPDVYLGVAPIERSQERWIVRDHFVEEKADEATSVEYAVVMRRLPDDRDALSLLEEGLLEPRHLDAVARRLARFHDGHGLGRPAPWSSEDWWQHLYAPVDECLASLRAHRPEGFAESELQELADGVRACFEALRPRFEERRLEGLAVDGHGDVHLQHVWFEDEDATPILIDCIEFDDELRRIDAANEVAFLSMDLAYRRRRDLADRFLRRYARERDDFALYGVVDAYTCYRALVRGKVAALAADDEGIPEAQRRGARASARRHLELARGAIRPPEPGALVLLCGTVGSGKSTVAEELADRTGGVVIASDRTRKHLAGIAVDEHGSDEADRGLYAPERTEAVYRALLERAAPVVGSGRIAILDATYAQTAERQRARSWAEQHGVSALLVRARCADEVALERLRRREGAGDDPSDAGPDFLSVSRARFEPPSEWPERDRFEVHTDRSDGPLELAAVERRLDATGGSGR